MPDIYEYNDESEWMKVCVPKMMEENRSNEQAVAICASMWRDKNDAAKYRAVKAVGDWELDVLAVPFHTKDSDKQWFDEETDVMSEIFQTPLVVYQHGIKQGAKDFQDKPLKLGDTVPGSLEKKPDGWHIRVVLDKTIKQARDIWEAAKRGWVAVSSGSISHLARLNIGGKNIPYEKTRPGKISVWALAEVSLWEIGNGNVRPSNPTAYALPIGAMKAIYRDAGIPFPDFPKQDGGLPEANGAAKRALELEKAKRLLKQTDKLF